jgi:hypothetical protein
MKTRLLISLILIFLLAGYCHFYTPVHSTQEHPRFTKMINTGEIISAWQGPWSCVADSRLNVLWEVKTDNESIHDGYWTYSWFDETHGKENFGDCYFEAQRCDTHDLIRHTNKQGLCNQRNWRLPTPDEFQSLIISPQRPGQTHINNDYFPFIHQGDYWTSASQQPLPKHFSQNSSQNYSQNSSQINSGALAVNFHAGQQVTLPYRNAAFVILVSSLTEANTTSQLSRRVHIESTSQKDTRK